MRERIEELISKHQGEEAFAVLNELITALAREGYSIRYETTIFIKSQLTISGMLQELDPEFKQDKHIMDRMSSQVMKELHVRSSENGLFPGVELPQLSQHVIERRRQRCSNEEMR